MQTAVSMGATNAFPPFLKQFLRLELEAIELYKLAIVRVQRCEDIALLGAVREAHDELAELLSSGRDGRHARGETDERPTVGHDWALLGGLTTDAQIFAFLEAAEELRERAYRAALRSDAVFGTARELLNAALEVAQKRRLALGARATELSVEALQPEAVCPPTPRRRRR